MHGTPLMVNPTNTKFKKQKHKPRNTTDVIQKMTSLDKPSMVIHNVGAHNKWDYDKCGGVWKLVYRGAARKESLCYQVRLLKIKTLSSAQK